MEKTGFTHSLPFRLLVALAVGIGVGLALSAAEGAAITNALLNIIVTVKFISSQFINFCVPLIIIGFIAPSITRLGNNASRMLIVALCIAYLSSIGALCIAYLSSIGAAFFATGAGFTILPFLNISPEVDGLKDLPPVVFELTIPQIMPVMSALFFSVLVGLSATWNKSKIVTGVLEEFQQIVLSIVTKFVIPVLAGPHRLHILHAGLRGNNYEAAPDLPDHHRYRYDWPLYLDDSSLWYRRRVLRKKSDEYCQELRPGLYDSCRNYVQCRYTFRST